MWVVYDLSQLNSVWQDKRLEIWMNALPRPIRILNGMSRPPRIINGMPRHIPTIIIKGMIGIINAPPRQHQLDSQVLRRQFGFLGDALCILRGAYTINSAHKFSICRHSLTVIVIYCTVLYCTVLHCTVLHCTVLYRTVLYCTALYCIIQYCIVQESNQLAVLSTSFSSSKAGNEGFLPSAGHSLSTLELHW